MCVIGRSRNISRFDLNIQTWRRTCCATDVWARTALASLYRACYDPRVYGDAILITFQSSMDRRPIPAVMSPNCGVMRAASQPLASLLDDDLRNILRLYPESGQLRKCLLSPQNIVNTTFDGHK